MTEIMELEFLQIYWWLLISVLGAILVFLLFVQGGQTLLLTGRNDSKSERLMLNALGHKWELTFTTLVVFGGAFFASFPLFYSTSFGGAYWLWMSILISFVLQAVSYEFRSKSGNLFGHRVYDIFLFFNGCVGCILLGEAVAMFFFGAEFTVTKSSLLDPGSPVISRWADTHGWEAIFNWKNLLLGLTVLFLARTQAALYFINHDSDDSDFVKINRGRVLLNGGIFVMFFLVFVAVLLTADGYRTVADAGLSQGRSEFEIVEYRYFHNYIDMWWCLAVLLVGVVMVLYAIIRTAFTPNFKSGIWWSGIGTVLVVLTLFWVAGYNSTPYYPSLTDASSSLTITNSSSSEFTLTTMTWVSVIIPFVVAYIAYAWYSMDKKDKNDTEDAGY